MKLSAEILLKLRSYNDPIVLVPVCTNTVRINDTSLETHKHVGWAGLVWLILHSLLQFDLFEPSPAHANVIKR